VVGVLLKGVRAIAGVALLGAFFAPSASAAFGIESFDAKVVDSGGQLEEQAGQHPFEGYTAFAMKTLPSGAPDGHVQNIRVDVPAGLISNPQAVPQCTDAQLELMACDPSSQIGKVDVGTYLGLRVALKLPLYNMTIGPSQVARFAFNPKQALAGPVGIVLGPLLEAAGVGSFETVEIVGGVRDTSDFGLFFTISDVAEKPEIVDSKLTFWGVPGGTAHDIERGEVCVTVAAGLPLCLPGGLPATAGQIPFLTDPTYCGPPLTTKLSVSSHAGEPDNAQVTTPDGAQDCDQVPFDPAIELAPETVTHDSPLGLGFNLHVPQTQFPDVIGTSHVKDVSATLPPGMTISPSAANGLEACTDAQLAKGTHDPVLCPAASKVGSVTITTPLLPDQLTGSIYVGQPLPGDRYRLFLVADGHGVTLRLKGSVLPDPQSGQITATFADNPQVPFTNFTLSFRNDALAPLASPLDCGSALASSHLTPWSGQPAAAPTDSVTVDGCDGSPFMPSLGATTGSAAAGALTPFGLTLARDDGNQFLSGVQASLPPGLLGRLSSAAQCADAQAATGACPTASRIGTASVKAGPGAQPFGLSGPAYLTGPYRGAPFGMAVVIRAIAGPFDLGTVVVRQQIQVDPDDAHITVVSDPLPQILEGVPIRLREVRVDVDRKDFMRNPTSCGTKQVGSTLGSTQGATANPAASFQVDACDRLDFGPKLALRLVGAKQTGEGDHPGVRAVATQPDRQAGIASTRVSLPLSLALDPANADELCSVEGGQQANCPKGSIIGSVSATSPILHRRLYGPVYFVQGVRTDPTTGRQIRTLPTLLATLRGEVAIDVRAVTSVERGHLVTTFPALPDAPITRFAMNISGGKHGVLVANHGLCNGRKQVATGAFGGHNGKQASLEVTLGLPCRKSPKLKLGKASWNGSRLTVGGRIAKAAKKRVIVRASCAGMKASQRAKPRRGRWTTTLTLPTSCASAHKLTLSARYAGDARLERATRTRSMRR
jgi:hypothetical protein